MDTMEVDSSDMDGGRGMDDPDEPSTPDGMFGMDSPFVDREKDEEPIKTIRYSTAVTTVKWHNYKPEVMHITNI